MLPAKGGHFDRAAVQLAVLESLLVRLLDVPARVDGRDARGGGRLLQAVDGLAHQATHLAETCVSSNVVNVGKRSVRLGLRPATASGQLARS